MKTNIPSYDLPLWFRKEPTRNIRLIIVTGLAVCAALWAMPGTARAEQLFASVNGTANNGGGSILQFAPNGIQSSLVSGLDRPRGLVFDGVGNLFVTTTTRDNSGKLHGSIFKITPEGAITAFATGFGANSFLEGLAMDSAGNVFVLATDFDDPNLVSNIFKATAAGTVTPFGSVGGLGFGLAFDSAGNLFAADAGDLTIYKFTPAGIQSVFAGPAAFSLAAGGPNGLAFDSFGNLYVSTTSGTFNNDVVLKFTPTGTETMFAAGLQNPRGLAFDGTGNLFVAEVPIGAGAIRKFNPSGAEVLPTFASGIGSPLTNQPGGPEFLAFPPNTLGGSNVLVNIGTVGSAGVTLTFPQVMSGGTTTVAPIDPNSAGTLPFGYELTGSNLAFEITTTATYTGSPIIIAFQVPSIDVVIFSQLRIFHNEGGTLVDRTASDPAPNPTTQTIDASVSSLSPFVIAKLATPTSMDQCKNGGWQTRVRANESRFNNQGDCIQYVNTGK